MYFLRGKSIRLPLRQLGVVLRLHSHLSLKDNGRSIWLTRRTVPFTKADRDFYAEFLRHPTLIAIARNGFTQSQQCNLKIRALKNFELQRDVLYRCAEKGLNARYAAGPEDALWIIANAHSQLHHVGVRKTYN